MASSYKVTSSTACPAPNAGKRLVVKEKIDTDPQSGVKTLNRITSKCNGTEITVTQTPAVPVGKYQKPDILVTETKQLCPDGKYVTGVQRKFKVFAGMKKQCRQKGFCKPALGL